MTPVFVFGSNLAGIHGAGAAKEALEHWGAKWGVGEGMAGRSYALPTKDYMIKTLPLETIAKHAENFLSFASVFPEHYFFVTRVGCGLAGYKDEDIAPLFAYASQLPNVGLCPAWARIIESQRAST